jgi:hypothetical protein
MDAAKKKAAAEIKAYKDRVRLEREAEGERALIRIGQEVRKKRRSKPKG